VRPPRLHLGRAGTASRLELFFDLAYVLVVIELAKGFYEDLSVHGLLVLVGLFTAIWFSWVGFTLYANRFDTDDVVFRIAKLVATASVVGCAASASDAVGKFAVPFAASYLLSRVVLFGLYVRAYVHVPEARSTVQVYLTTVGASALLWAASLLTPEPVRYVLWVIAVVVSAAGPLLTSLRSQQVPLHIEHLPERFALLVILVLGEAVGGAARGVHDASWTLTPVVVGVLAFGVAAGMWWIYFDITAPSSSDQLHQAEHEADASDTVDEERGRRTDESGSATGRAGDPEDHVTREGGPPGRHDDEDGNDEATDARHNLFIYGHLPLSLGVVLVGVGLEELVVHPDTPGPSVATWVFTGGLAVFLIGVSLIISGTTQTIRSVWPWPAAAIPLILISALLPFPSSLVQVAVYAVAMLTLAWQGTRVSRRTDTALLEADDQPENS
jgi:low temperature requirement protein LtrA